MKLILASVASAALILGACSSGNGNEEAASSSSEALSSAIRFRRGSGAVEAGREVCDESRDPATQNRTTVILSGLVPSDVETTLSPSPTQGPELVLRIKGRSDVLTTRFFQTRGEDCWAGVKKISWDNGDVWRSIADARPESAGSCASSCGHRSPDGCYCDDACAKKGDCCADKAATCDSPKPVTGSCAGRCGGAGTGTCHCDEKCAAKGDCCADRQPLCAGDGGLGTVGSADLVFDRTRSAQHSGEDWTGHTVRYDYRRLVDTHPECVEPTSDGGSVVRIVMTSKLGSAPAVEQVVSGFSTSASAPITIQRDVALTTRGTTLNLKFRCGRGDARDDNDGRGYAVFIIR